METVARNLVNTKVCAEKLGVSIYFLHTNWRALEGVYRAGRLLRFDVDEVRESLRRKALRGATQPQKPAA